MHGDVPDAGVGDDPEDVRVGQAARDVVDDPGARLDRGGGDLGAHRVDADHRAVGRQGADDRYDARQLLGDQRPGGARSGRLAADVEDVGAVREQLPAVRDRRLDRVVPAAVAERVGGDVDDPHDQRQVSHARNLARDGPSRAGS